MIRTLQERIDDAAQGRKFWLRLVENYQIDSSVYVIVIPEEEQQYDVALSNLSQYMKKRNIKKAIILAYNKRLTGQSKQENIQIVDCKREDIDKLIQFYCLYEFASNVVVASLEKPSGRMGKGMIDKKGLTGAEVFAGVVYSLVD